MRLTLGKGERLPRGEREFEGALAARMELEVRQSLARRG